MKGACKAHTARLCGRTEAPSAATDWQARRQESLREIACQRNRTSPIWLVSSGRTAGTSHARCMHSPEHPHCKLRALTGPELLETCTTCSTTAAPVLCGDQQVHQRHPPCPSRGGGGRQGLTPREDATQASASILARVMAKGQHAALSLCMHCSLLVVGGGCPKHSDVCKCRRSRR